MCFASVGTDVRWLIALAADASVDTDVFDPQAHFIDESTHEALLCSSKTQSAVVSSSGAARNGLLNSGPRAN